MFKIDKTNIGKDCEPFIIAEMSGNHNQSLERALEIVQAAANSGAHALKLQTYTADTLTLNVKKGDFLIEDEKSLWNGESLHELYKKAYTPWEWHKPIMDKAAELGMICFSSPFDNTAVDFLEELNVPAYKIASFENTHLPLIEKVAKTGKPLIISTGMASVADIDETVRYLRKIGCKEFMLLKCTSTYPASPINSNVITIPHMRQLFDCEIGLSDHTMGIGAAIAAVSHGATLIEKHFTLNRLDGGVDSAFSLEPDEMKLLVIESKRAWESLGQVKYEPTKEEKKSKQFKRSIYISEDMKKGEIFSTSNLKIVRPGNGLKPKYYKLFIGKKITKNASKGTAATFDLLSAS